MTKIDTILNELQGIRASAQVLADRATRLETQLRAEASVSTGTNSQQFSKRLAKVMAGREKRLQKNNRQGWTP